MTDSSSDLDRPIDEVDREEEQDEQFDFAGHQVVNGGGKVGRAGG